MNNNSLIEIGSKVDIIISFPNQIVLGGKIYAPYEPYLYLKEARAILSYKEKEKTSTSVRNIGSINLTSIDKLIVSQVSFSQKILNLMLCYQNKNTAINKRKFETLTAENGIIYLNQEISTTESLFVYDSNFNKIEGSVYSAINNSLSNVLFEEDKNYLISFSSELVGTYYSLKQSNIPYMIIEIQAVGNIDKVKKELIIHLEKASLNSLVEFNFTPGDQIYSPLEFTIIEDTDNYILFEE